MRVRQEMMPGGIAGTLLMVMLATGCGSDPAPQGSPMAAAAAGSPDTGPHSTAAISGTITYLQRIALPKDAVVIVSVIDLSRGGASPVILAEQQFEAGGREPIRFDLPYDPSRLGKTQACGVQARILVDGALWFVNEQPVALPTRGGIADVQIVVQPTAAKS